MKNFNTILGGSLEWHTDPKDEPSYGSTVLAAVYFNDMSGFFLTQHTAMGIGRFGLGSQNHVLAWSYYDESIIDSYFEKFKAENNEELRKMRIAQLEEELKQLKGE